MAIYHLSVKIISRSRGRSAVASAAYRAGEKLHDLREGKTHDYSRKGGVVHREVIAPAGAPEWATQREVLWNRVEASEKRKDSQLAREVEIALPRELGPKARAQLVRSFVKEEFTSKGMIADVAIHNPKASDGQENPHVHIMLTMRHLENWEFGGKNRQWNRDFVDGQKSINDAVGGFANTHGKGNGYVGKSTAGLIGLRGRWANYVNDALSDANKKARIDHRSYADQGIDRMPQPKIGAAKWVQDRIGEARDQIRSLALVKQTNAIRHGLERIERGESMRDAQRIARAISSKARAMQQAIARGHDPTRNMNRVHAGLIHPKDLEPDR